MHSIIPKSQSQIFLKLNMQAVRLVQPEKTRIQTRQYRSLSGISDSGDSLGATVVIGRGTRSIRLLSACLLCDVRAAVGSSFTDVLICLDDDRPQANAHDSMSPASLPKGHTAPHSPWDETGENSVGRGDGNNG